MHLRMRLSCLCPRCRSRSRSRSAHASECCPLDLTATLVADGTAQRGRTTHSKAGCRSGGFDTRRPSQVRTGTPSPRAFLSSVSRTLSVRILTDASTGSTMFTPARIFADSVLQRENKRAWAPGYRARKADSNRNLLSHPGPTPTEMERATGKEVERLAKRWSDWHFSVARESIVERQVHVQSSD